ncbi:MAG TPA: antibiotic biosynthesis monooxygenase [Leptolyngbyaceae cyanobacterium M33_DOE_097]|uniref:Antibiotic biosynthesis monooxygenase n=1 Tax=Oscillatoriales cyanobacterium SpSt-418 TaxID=2282169 RepID=A0A7C3PBZ0_9CYAN|nr:antibiotic biosynthesis monooxygenase [Leptolyngbyaceae cyanobacterium M33_DOE_097]
MQTQNEPVTVVVAQQVKPGHEPEFEGWIRNITSVASTYPGYLGTHVIQPQLGVRSEYVIIFRFDNYANLKDWMTSRDRANFLDQAKPLIQADPQVQEINGIQAWFSIPGKPLQTPPRYKTALLTWGAVYVLLNLLNLLLRPLLKGLPDWMVTFVFSAVMVLLLTYVVMPRVTHLFRKWLHPRSN